MNWLTTSSALGTTVRYALAIFGSIVATLAVIGWLTPEQAQALREQIDALTLQLPQIGAAIGYIISFGTAIYGILTKSHSDKADAVAKTVDKEVPVGSPVVIKTPEGVPDIVVPPKA